MTGKGMHNPWMILVKLVILIAGVYGLWMHNWGWIVIAVILCAVMCVIHCKYCCQGKEEEKKKKR